MNLSRVSKTMSWMLRHCQEPRYIDLKGGWASATDILAALKKKYPDVTINTIEQIVAKDEKGRYSFDSTGTKIRANQGHSIPGVVIEMEAPEPPEFLYHGTATRFLDTIMKDGLKPMTRQFVHISPDYETAVKVGSRHGKSARRILSMTEMSCTAHPMAFGKRDVFHRFISQSAIQNNLLRQSSRQIACVAFLSRNL